MLKETCALLTGAISGDLE